MSDNEGFEFSWSPDRPSEPRANFTEEEVEPGVVLQSYTKRSPSEDGTYVVVTTHNERIERVPQPPTPEELAAQAKSERIAMLVVGGMVASFLGLVGWLAYQDEKKSREERRLRNERYGLRSTDSDE